MKWEYYPVPTLFVILNSFPRPLLSKLHELTLFPLFFNPPHPLPPKGGSKNSQCILSPN